MKKPKKRSGPTALGELLSEFLQTVMPKHLSQETRVFGAWPQAVGLDVSRQAKPKTFRNGILFVETLHPVWTSELTAKRHLILRKINEALSENLVREIQFRQARL